MFEDRVRSLEGSQKKGTYTRIHTQACTQKSTDTEDEARKDARRRLVFGYGLWLMLSMMVLHHGERERQRETERDRERDTERQRERQRETYTYRNVADAKDETRKDARGRLIIGKGLLADAVDDGLANAVRLLGQCVDEVDALLRCREPAMWVAGFEGKGIEERAT
jgi:hypothetical protein